MKCGRCNEEHDIFEIEPGFWRPDPVLVLVDEWVAYARQLVGKHDLPAGDFEAQASFAQALTEAAKAAQKTLLVASIPASKMEIGGEHGPGRVRGHRGGSRWRS